MPPLLAALLMIEFGCTMKIIEAIDCNMEWMAYDDVRGWISCYWYGNEVGQIQDQKFMLLGRGTFSWPGGCAIEAVYFTDGYRQRK
jgi:hypothetical protein